MHHPLTFIVYMSMRWCSISDVIVYQEEYIQRSSQTVALNYPQIQTTSRRSYIYEHSG